MTQRKVMEGTKREKSERGVKGEAEGNIRKYKTISKVKATGEIGGKF